MICHLRVLTPIAVGVTSIDYSTISNLRIGQKSKVGITKTKDAWTPFLTTLQHNQSPRYIINAVSVFTPWNIEICVLEEPLAIGHRHEVAEIEHHVHGEGLTDCASGGGAHTWSI
jgi:hypothetical protein